jgi:hypothetical protein
MEDRAKDPARSGDAPKEDMQTLINNYIKAANDYSETSKKTYQAFDDYLGK